MGRVAYHMIYAHLVEAQDELIARGDGAHDAAPGGLLLSLLSLLRLLHPCLLTQTSPARVNAQVKTDRADTAIPPPSQSLD